MARDDREGAGEERSFRELPTEVEEAAPEAPAGAGAQEESPASWWRVAAETLLIFLVAALVAVFIQSFFMKAFIIPTGSMSPTLQVGDRIMAEKVTYWFRKPRRGDIVVFRYPPDTPPAMNTTNPLYWPFEQIGETLHLTHRGSTPYVKRVVATGGEMLELRKGKLYINGKLIEEPYISDSSSNFGPYTVPEGQLFVMGDNRLNSADSRVWGTVPLRSVIGKVFLIWWPLSHFGGPG